MVLTLSKALCCSYTGHRLGNRSDYSNHSEPVSSEYSNLLEPAFNSSSSGSTLSGPQHSSSTALPTNTTDINTQSESTVPSQESQPASSVSPWSNSLPVQPFSQSSSQSLSSPASALAPSSTTEKSQPPPATVDRENDLSVSGPHVDHPKTTHTLTEGISACIDTCMYILLKHTNCRDNHFLAYLGDITLTFKATLMHT